jgi:hypothetical protein
MVFSKSFPKYFGKSIWEIVSIDDSLEKEVEKRVLNENVVFMERSIENARQIFIQMKLKPVQSDIVIVAIALFEKRACHELYHKEDACKRIFSNLNNFD